MKTLIEWLLSKLFPVHGVEMAIAPADNFVSSDVLIRVIKDEKDFRRVMETTCD